MPQRLTYQQDQQEKYVSVTMLAFALSLVGFGFLRDTPSNIIQGLIAIICSPSGLIMDSVMVGGVGAAFVNAGLVMLLSIALFRWTGQSLTGISVACLLLMAGFSLFGKDILNIIPILLGGALYSAYKKESFGHHVHVSLFGTALAPVVTEIALLGGWVNLVIAVAVGMLIGFLLPAVAKYTMRVHQGYNLYNIGFTAGLVGMVLVSLMKSFGLRFDDRLVWSTGNNITFLLFLLVQFGLMIALGFCWHTGGLRVLSDLTRHSGRAMTDFIAISGYPVTLINMGVTGLAGTAYVLCVGGELNGPTIGGIYTICGFGAYGKHLKNIVPVMLGVVASSAFTVWDLNDPGVLLAALFSTALAPIAGRYGWKWGMTAGAVHAAVVLNTSVLHGGLNLYNNGFAAGLICVMLLPLLDTVHAE